MIGTVLQFKVGYKVYSSANATTPIAYGNALDNMFRLNSYTITDNSMMLELFSLTSAALILLHTF